MLLPGSHPSACEIQGSHTLLRILRSIWRMNMATKPVIAPSPEAPISRRGFLMKLGLLFNGLAAMVVAFPVARYLFSSAIQGRANGYLSWVPLGNVSNFP